MPTPSPAKPATARKPDVFEAYEQLPSSYHKDPRWKEVQRLRKAGDQLRANGLVFEIRSAYGFEG